MKDFTEILFNSPINSPELHEKWGLLDTYTKKKYIDWFYSDRTQGLEDYWSYNEFKTTLDPYTHKIVTAEQLEYPNSSYSSPPIYDKTVIEFFEKFTKVSLGLKDDGMGSGGSRRRRRRSRPSRKYKKSSKRVFRKKSRSTRRR